MPASRAPTHHPSTDARRIEVLENALAMAQDLLHRDDLTPLLNRRGFRRACDQSAATRTIETRMCCVMMDLDDFRSINNRYGHPAGDAALVYFAQSLRAHVRQADAIARLGGDEFALLLPNTRDVDGLRLLGRLRNVFAQSPFLIREKPVTLSFSAGISERKANESLSDALIRADGALLDAKRSGKAAIRVDIPLET